MIFYKKIQELMEQLSAADQGKVDELNDAIRRLNQENKEAFSARMNLEANKNKLENLLTNNLIRQFSFYSYLKMKIKKHFLDIFLNEQT